MNWLWSQEWFPHKWWSFLNINDLEELKWVCDVCGTTIRYEHYLTHELWEWDVCAWAECASKLSEEYITFEKQHKWKAYKHKWTTNLNGNLIWTTKIHKWFKFKILIFRDKESKLWKIQYRQINPNLWDKVWLTKSFWSSEEAKDYALELLSKIIFQNI